MNIVERFNRYAIEAHEGQKRSNGEAYVNHCERVEEIVKDMAKFWFTSDGNAASNGVRNRDHLILSATAWGHDILEDNPAYVSKILRDMQVEHFDCSHEVLTAIQAMSRMSKQEGIITYLDRVKANPYARVVKLADLRDNMSDLKPGSLLDKYRLCQQYLTT